MAISTKTKEYVALTYAKYFGRTADADTISNYASIGKTSKILKQIIKDSNIEQYSVHGDDLKAEVHNEFQNLFSRNADNTELEKYVKVLKKGKDLPINSIVKKATKFDKDVYNNKQAIAKYVAENGGGVFDLSKVTKLNPIKVESLTSLTDLQTKIEALPENSKVPSTFDGETYILTEGVDTGKDFVGTSKNDEFVAKKGTWGVADKIDGGKGTDGLTIVTNTVADLDFSVNTMKSIEIVNITSSDAANDIDLDTTTAGKVADNFKAVTDLYVTASDKSIDVKVDGKTNVTATTKTTAETIDVTGGKVVNATATAGVVKIKGDALTTVTVKGGIATSAVTNTVDGAGTAGETLKSVSLEGVAGAVAVGGNAIDTLTLKDQTTALALDTTITNTKSTALTVNLNNVETGSKVTAGAKAETVTINSNGAKANALTLVATAGKTLNIAGDAAFTLDTTTPATIKDIVSTNTKGVTITDALAKDVKFTGGTGADSVKLTTAFEKAITMGAGDDKVTYAGPASKVEGKVGSVDAGDGKDTISMTTGLIASDIVTDVTGIFNSTFKNFEVLEVSNGGAAVVIDVERINNVSTVVIAGDLTGASAINNLANNSTVKFTANSTNLTANVKNSAGNTDVLNVELEGSAPVDAKQLTVNSVETINIISNDTATPATGIKHLLDLRAADATSIVVTGDAGVTFATTTSAVKLTSFDASASTVGVTFASNSTANVTIKGGAGDDILTGGALNDTIIGGAGDDRLDGGAGVDTLTGGAGKDKFIIGAQDTTTTGIDKITDFVAGTDTIVTKTALGVASTNAATSLTDLRASDLSASANVGAAANAAMIASTKTAAGEVVLFTYKSNVYAVVESGGAAGFNDGTDFIVEITGVTGTVTFADFYVS
ncbi:bluetail domain-containing putative surface protein [Aliarcobacter cryaerophilus]|uniref:beta strand repeat-containing protein n=1 Tax=Aliarcobacter cryaerophilus TaxID=28198 RepID=UPI003DA28D66